MEGETLFDAAIAAAQSEPEPEFENMSDDTTYLMEIGHLKGSVQIGGNEITFRTLSIGEELEAASLANKYKNTLEEGRALMTALVAQSIVTVNGSPLLGVTLGSFQETPEARFQFVQEWHWAVVRYLYAEYSKLVDQVYKAFDELKKA